MSAGQAILSIPGTGSFPASHQDTAGVVGAENKHANSYFRSLPPQQARRHHGIISVTSLVQKERTHKRLPSTPVSNHVHKRLPSTPVNNPVHKRLPSTPVNNPVHASVSEDCKHQTTSKQYTYLVVILTESTPSV